MKTRNWILLFVLIALACIAALLLMNRAPAAQAEIYSDGQLVRTISLSQDGEYRIDSDNGWNVIIVESGTVRVASASCVNQDCVHRGAANGGAPIVCLPNRLVIRFTGEAAYDALVG